MPDELITFVIEGMDERNGNITAETFLAKIRQFVTTLYSFERAFAKRDQRLIDLEVIDLSRQSPTQVRFKARSRVVGYDARAAMRWTFEQFERIQRGETVDQSIPQKAIDNVIELSQHRTNIAADFKLLRVEYEQTKIAFDPLMEARALTLRETRRSEEPPIWQAGISRGSLFGELRGVMDFNGERKFYIRPPSGASQVQCIFPEEMRALMNEHLFQVVRVFGFLRYDGRKPFPYLMEAERLEGIKEDETRGHFSDLRGFFRGMEISEQANGP
jgi:hypothetical protein